MWFAQPHQQMKRRRVLHALGHAFPEYCGRANRAASCGLTKIVALIRDPATLAFRSGKAGIWHEPDRTAGTNFKRDKVLGLANGYNPGGGENM